MIKSFKIDHTRLLRGVYQNSVDRVGDEYLTTFDIRLKSPYVDTPLEPATTHTMEHIGATLLRTDDMWEHKIIYFGPMGCQTGFYLIVKGQHTPHDVLPLLKRVFNKMSEWEKAIPGATNKECGNYLLQNINGAREEAKIFVEQILNEFYPANENYPKITEK